MKTIFITCALMLSGASFAQSADPSRDAASTAARAGAAAGSKHDGKHAAHRAEKRAAHFAKLDTDKNGQISRAEAAGQPRLAKHFDLIDTNKDAALSQAELKAAHAAHGRKPAAK